MVPIIIKLSMSLPSVDSFYEKLVKKNSRVDENIAVTYSSLKHSVRLLENASMEGKNAVETKYMKAFRTTMVEMMKELEIVRNKYLEIDKQKLKDEKSMALAEDIHLFREEAAILKAQCQQTANELKQVTTSNSGLQFEVECLEQSLKKKQRESSKQKSIYLTNVDNFQKMSEMRASTKAVNPNVSMNELTPNDTKRMSTVKTCEATNRNNRFRRASSKKIQVTSAAFEDIAITEF